MLLPLVQEDPEANLESLANKVSPKRAYGKKVAEMYRQIFPQESGRLQGPPRRTRTS